MSVEAVAVPVEVTAAASVSNGFLKSAKAATAALATVEPVLVVQLNSPLPEPTVLPKALSAPRLHFWSSAAIYLTTAA